jgi:hypothetical protein
MSDHCDRVEESMKGKDVLTNAPSPEENAPVNSEEALMEWKCFEDKHNRGDWRVEAIDFDDEGKVYVTIFSGPEAQERAEEYAALKNGQESRLERIAS